MTARIGVVVFPGSNCEHDVVKALGLVGSPRARAELVWHGERSLAGYDAVVLPGGFAHGDYLRPGAIARFSPNNRRVHVTVARLDSRNLRHFTLLDVEERSHLGPRGPALGCVVSDIGVIGGAPAESSGHRGAGRLHIAQADRPALRLVRREQLRPAPSFQRRRQFPGEIDGISYACVHPKTARRDDQMRCVSCHKNAALAITLRAQQMLRPFVDGKHFELNWHGQRLLEDLGHFRIT